MDAHASTLHGSTGSSAVGRAAGCEACAAGAEPEAACSLWRAGRPVRGASCSAALPCGPLPLAEHAAATAAAAAAALPGRRAMLGSCPAAKDPAAGTSLAVPGPNAAQLPSCSPRGQELPRCVAQSSCRADAGTSRFSLSSGSAGASWPLAPNGSLQSYSTALPMHVWFHAASRSAASAKK